MWVKFSIREGVEIAKLLETTAEYLVTGITQENLTGTEQRLIRAYRKLSSADQKNVMLAVDAWAGKDEPRQI